MSAPSSIEPAGNLQTPSPDYVQLNSIRLERADQADLQDQDQDQWPWGGPKGRLLGRSVLVVREITVHCVVAVVGTS